MSSHYATLLNCNFDVILPHADVYITDWADARMVPVTERKFDLDDHIDYVINMFHGLVAGHPSCGGVPNIGAGAGRDGRHGSPR